MTLQVFKCRRYFAPSFFQNLTQTLGHIFRNAALAEHPFTHTAIVNAQITRKRRLPVVAVKQLSDRNKLFRGQNDFSRENVVTQIYGIANRCFIEVFRHGPSIRPAV